MTFVLSQSRFSNRFYIKDGILQSVGWVEHPETQLQAFAPFTPCDLGDRQISAFPLLRLRILIRQLDPRPSARRQHGGIRENLHPPPIIQTRMIRRLARQLSLQRWEHKVLEPIARSRGVNLLNFGHILSGAQHRNPAIDAVNRQRRIRAVQFHLRRESLAQNRGMRKHDRADSAAMELPRDRRIVGRRALALLFAVRLRVSAAPFNGVVEVDGAQVRLGGVMVSA